MEEGPGPVAGKMCAEDFVGGKRCRERQRAASQSLGGAQDVGRDRRLLAGEQSAGAAPAGHHLVGDEKCVGALGNALELGKN